MHNKKIIIYQPWGGLGDNLAYSTLPELFSKKGYDVYLSVNNVVRNPEICDLVWMMNPYIKGIAEHNDGEIVGSETNYRMPDDNQNEYFIHRIELANGFDRTNYYPKIYYNPKLLPEHKNDIIIDITGTSSVYAIHKYIEYINYFVPIIKNQPEKSVKIVTFEKIVPGDIFNNVYSILKSQIPYVQNLTISSLISYCDVINSCDTFIIVNSGVNSLASAIKQDKELPNIICYNPWQNFSPQKIKGFYHYKNVEYFQSKIE